MSRKRNNGEGTLIKNDSGTYSIRKGYEIAGKKVMKRFTGKTQAEAKKKKLEFEERLRVLPPTENNKEILSEYMEKWAKLYKANTVKPSTYDSIEDAIDRIKKYDIANIPIYQIDLDSCQTFISNITNDGYSLETIKKTYNCVNSCLKKAVLKGDLRSNPFNGVELPTEDTVLKKAKEIEIFDDADIERIYSASYTKFGNGAYVYRVGAAIVFMLYTGLRVGECIGLKTTDIDLKKKEIYIEDNVSIVRDRSENASKRYKTIVTSTKTKKSTRTVPLSNRAFEALNIAMGNRVIDNEIVFQSNKGTRFNSRNIERSFELIQKTANTKLRTSGVHCLRHSFASMLIRKGVDIKIVSELLGHAKVSTTYDIYAHVIEGQKRQSIDLLDVIN